MKALVLRVNRRIEYVNSRQSRCTFCYRGFRGFGNVTLSLLSCKEPIAELGPIAIGLQRFYANEAIGDFLGYYSIWLESETCYDFGHVNEVFCVGYFIWKRRKDEPLRNRSIIKP